MSTQQPRRSHLTRGTQQLKDLHGPKDTGQKPEKTWKTECANFQWINHSYIYIWEDIYIFTYIYMIYIYIHHFIIYCYYLLLTYFDCCTANGIFSISICKKTATTQLPATLGSTFWRLKLVTWQITASIWRTSKFISRGACRSAGPVLPTLNPHMLHAWYIYLEPYGKR